MQAAGTLAAPFGPALSRSTAGRALIYAAIVSKPSQVTPEQASGDMAAFLAARSAVDAILSAALPFTGTIPADVPVTIAWGEHDHLLLPHQARVAKARLPQATMVLLPHCGHVPMTDNPQLVANILLTGSRPVARPARQRATSTLTGSGARLWWVPARAARQAGQPRAASCQPAAVRRRPAGVVQCRRVPRQSERVAALAGRRRAGFGR